MSNEANLILRKLTLDDEKEFLTAVSSWIEDAGFVFAQSYQKDMSFEKYLAILSAQERGEQIPAGWVPMTSLFGFSNGALVGRLAIRHSLSDFLLKIGGHIGYGVLPQYRRRGFAVSMLRQSLPMARNLQIEKALLTCDDTNIGSIKTIEACGGVLENTISAGENSPLKRRYWINTLIL